MATVSLKSMCRTIIFTPIIDEGGMRDKDGRRREGRKERKMLGYKRLPAGKKGK